MTTMTTMTKSIILSKNNKKVAKTHKMLCILVAFWSHLVTLAFQFWAKYVYTNINIIKSKKGII